MNHMIQTNRQTQMNHLTQMKLLTHMNHTQMNH